MARLAYGHAITDFVSKFRVIRPRLNMMSNETPPFLVAYLAGIVVSLKNRTSPIDVHGCLNLSSPPIPLVSRVSFSLGELRGIAPLFGICSPVDPVDKTLPFNGIGKLVYYCIFCVSRLFRTGISAFLGTVFLLSGRWGAKLHSTIQATCNVWWVLAFATTVFCSLSKGGNCFKLLSTPRAPLNHPISLCGAKRRMAALFTTIFRQSNPNPVRFGIEFFAAKLTIRFHGLLEIKTPLRLWRYCLGSIQHQPLGSGLSI
jgi:hypothetical protein